MLLLTPHEALISLPTSMQPPSAMTCTTCQETAKRDSEHCSWCKNQRVPSTASRISQYISSFESKNEPSNFGGFVAVGYPHKLQNGKVNGDFLIHKDDPFGELVFCSSGKIECDDFDAAVTGMHEAARMWIDARE